MFIRHVYKDAISPEMEEELQRWNIIPSDRYGLMAILHMTIRMYELFSLLQNAEDVINTLDAIRSDVISKISGIKGLLKTTGDHARDAVNRIVEVDNAVDELENLIKQRLGLLKPLKQDDITESA